MKYSPSSDNSLLYGKNQFIYRTEETDDRIDIFLKSSVHSCKCALSKNWDRAHYPRFSIIRGNFQNY